MKYSEKSNFIYAVRINSQTTTALIEVKWVPISQHFEKAVECKNDDALVNEYHLSLQKQAADNLKDAWAQQKKKGPVTVTAFAYQRKQDTLGSHEQRLTLFFHNYDWFTFDLQASDKTATMIFYHDKMTDAVLWRANVGAEEQVAILGNLRKNDQTSQLQESGQTKPYNNWVITYYDLQANTLEQSAQDYQIKIQADLRVNEKNDSKPDCFVISPLGPTYEAESCPYFATQVFYKSRFSKRLNVCSTVAVFKENRYSEQVNQPQKGKKQTVFEIKDGLKFQQNSARILTCQPMNMELSNHHVSYPLLMYLSPTPMQDTLNVANLAVDCPQKRINIHPYRFLQFVKTGTQDVEGFKNNGEAVIYFLAEHMVERKVRLFYYRTNPWRKECTNSADCDCVKYQHDCPCSRQNNLQIIPGEVKLPESYRFVRKQEAILLKKETSYGLKMVLIIQYYTNSKNIHCCYLGGRAPLPLIRKDETHIAQPLTIQPGPHNTCLFVQSDASHSYQIMSISLANQKHDDDSIHCIPLYQQSAKILVWQIRHDSAISESDDYQMQLLILDQERNYKLLGQPKFKFAQKSQSSDDDRLQMVLVKKQDMSGKGLKFEYLVAQLFDDQFSSVILGERQIIVPHYEDDQKQFQLQKTGFNVNSQTFYTCNFLEFPADKCLAKFEQNQTLLDECEVLSIQHLNWIGKYFAVVKEGRMSYFETSKSSELRRNDFMDYQMQFNFMRQIKVFDTVFHVYIQNWCLVFDINTHLLVDRFPCLKTKICRSSHDGCQYVLESVQGTKPVVKRLIRYTSDGKRVCVSDDILITNVMKELDKLLKSTQPTKKQQAAKVEGEHEPNSVSRYVRPFLYLVTSSVPSAIFSSKGQIIYVMIPNIQEPKIDNKKLVEPLEGSSLPELKSIDEMIVDNKTKFNVLKTIKNVESKIKDGLFIEGTEVVLYSLYGDIFQALLRPVNDCEKSSQTKMQIQITDDYLILLCAQYIFFVKLTDIEEKQNQKFQNDHLKEGLLDYVEVLHLEGQIEANVLNLEQLFDEAALRTGVKINQIMKQQLRTFQKDSQDQQQQHDDKERLPTVNMLQITTISTILLWDIDNNEEFHTVTGYDQFLQSENEFLRLGVIQMLPKCPKKGVRELAKVKKITHNILKTQFCIPKVVHIKKVATCFSLFSELDVREFISIRQTLEKNEVLREIDPVAVTATVYGATMFSLFQQEPDLIGKIKEQIENSHLDPFTNSQGVQFDNIYIRQVYNLLRLPHNPQGIDKLVFYNFKRQEAITSLCKQIKSQQQVDVSESLLVSEVVSKLHYMDMATYSSKFNVIQCVLFEKEKDDDEKIKELQELIGLMLLARECSLTDLVANMDCFKELFEFIKSSASINEFLSNSLIETEMTIANTTFVLDEGSTCLVFGSNTSQLSEEFIKEEFKRADLENQTGYLQMIIKALRDMNVLKPAERPLKQVKVTIVEINWLNNNCRDLFYFLATFLDPKIYNNELIKVLLIEQDYTDQILIRVTFAYLVYCICTIYFFTQYVTGNEGSPEDGLYGGSIKAIFLKWMIIILTGYFVLIELKQMQHLGFHYVQDKWNWINLGSYFANFTILGIYIWDVSYDPLQLAYATSFASLVLWAQGFYWMRLFKPTSFYVLMISETMYDIRYFIFMFVLCVATFANAILILDLAQVNAEKLAISEEEYERLIPDSVGNDVLDSVLNQYLLGLGEFTLDSYPSNGIKYMVWFYFVLATIITNINFLNVLIAIISDTYAKITEAKACYALMQRTEIYADFIQMVTISPKMNNNRFLYIMQPVEVGEETEDWSGSINALKKQLQKGIGKVDQRISQVALKSQQQSSLLMTQLETIDEKLEKMRESISKIVHDQMSSVHSDLKRMKTFNESKQQADSEIERVQKEMKEQLGHVQKEMNQNMTAILTALNKDQPGQQN